VSLEVLAFSSSPSEAHINMSEAYVGRLCLAREGARISLLDLVIQFDPERDERSQQGHENDMLRDAAIKDV